MASNEQQSTPLKEDKVDTDANQYTPTSGSKKSPESLKVEQKSEKKSKAAAKTPTNQKQEDSDEIEVRSFSFFIVVFGFTVITFMGILFVLIMAFTNKTPLETVSYIIKSVLDEITAKNLTAPGPALGGFRGNRGPGVSPNSSQTTRVDL